MTQDTDPTDASNDTDEQTETGPRTEAAGMLSDDLEKMNDTESRYADPKDGRVPRDGDGNRIPQDVEAGDWGLHLVVPMNYGDIQSVMGDGSQHDVEEEALARIFDCPADENGEYDPNKSGYILKPDYSADADEWAREVGRKPRGRVTAAYIEDQYPLKVRDVLSALFEASRIEASVVMDGTTANVEVDEGNQS